MRKKLLCFSSIILCITLMLSGCGAYIHRIAETVNGEVEVFNGARYVTITPEKDVPVNTILPEDFVLAPEGNKVYCGGEYSAVWQGIDVSSHQQTIDWQQVAESGIDFAIIRMGGRYYAGDRTLYADDNYEVNLEGAKAAGLKVGVYFFSQAVTAEEAAEEARMTLALLDGAELDLPVFFDWERMQGGLSETLDGETMTLCAKTYCETVEAQGYEAGLYFNLDTSYYGYTMAELTDYVFWCAAPGDYPYCYYAHTLWQYSFEGKVPGIDANCDLDMMFIK